MKIMEEAVFGEVKGRNSGVNERIRAREGVILLVKEELERYVKEWKEVSRLMWMRMTLGCERWVFVAAYGRGSEISEEERDDFWEELSECLNDFRQDENIVLLYLNARVNELEIEGVIGKFGALV